MKKLLLVIGLGILAHTVLLTTSCSKEETYSQKLEKEKKAIDKFIADSSFQVEEVPSDSVFKKGVFYKMQGLYTTSEYIYVQIIDSGNIDKKAKSSSTVCIRVKNGIELFNRTVKYDNHEGFTGQEWEFPYKSFSSGGCEGFVIPLKFLGEGAVVRMIVPSKLGLSNERQMTVTPIFFDRLTYTRFY